MKHQPAPHRSPSHPVSRRAFLGGLGAALITPALLPAGRHARAAERVQDLILYGPPAGPSIVLAQAVATGALASFADRPGFKVWQNPDEMRSGLTSGTMQAVVLPVQVAANLYNRGMKLKLLNVMTQGLIYILSGDASIDDIPALKGKTLAVPFRNDMPDLVMARLLQHHALEPGRDLVIANTGTPTEAIQMLLAGRVEAVLAPEPACTAAILKGRQAGRTIFRAIDIQEAWGQISGGEPVLPQAGLALVDAFTDATPGIGAALQTALAAAADAVNADPDAAAAHASEALDFPAPVLAGSIPFSRLVAVRATTARPSIERMLKVLADRDPAIIGGKLPDAGFYL